MQSKEKIWSDENLRKVLKENGVVIMPTDTIYGMVGRAENESVVNRIYKIRKRDPDKPCIILIGDLSELEKFSVILSKEQKNKIQKFWFTRHSLSEGVYEPTSIVLECLDEKFSYLHRGTKTLAFRLPNSLALRKLLLETGPLIAPSANLETFPPNDNVEDAKKHFGDSVDLYMDVGTLTGKASQLIKLHKDGTVDILRA
jgi:L-threonylcarbamoyladenylate synthase